MRKARITVRLPVSIMREGPSYIAFSPALDLATSARTFALAKKRFAEVVGIFFEELIQKGTLEEVLGSLGWENVKDRWLPPSIVAQETEEITVPFANATAHAGRQS